MRGLGGTRPRTPALAEVAPNHEQKRDLGGRVESVKEVVAQRLLRHIGPQWQRQDRESTPDQVQEPPSPQECRRPARARQRNTETHEQQPESPWQRILSATEHEVGQVRHVVNDHTTPGERGGSRDGWRHEPMRSGLGQRMGRSFIPLFWCPPNEMRISCRLSSRRPHKPTFLSGVTGGFARTEPGARPACRLQRDREALQAYRGIADQLFHSGAPAHLRLAEIYEGQGEREKAAEHYARFAELWKDCDPELRPLVEEARRRMAK
jgi:hypothetical protein